MSTPRILVFSREYPPATIGGTSTVARNLAVGLVAEGWAVDVVTTAPQSGTDVVELIDGVRVHRSGMDSIYNASSGLDSGIRAHRRLFTAAERVAAESGAPQVIALPDLFCYPEAAMFARRHDLPLINILLQDFRAITPYDRDTHHVSSGVSADREHLLAVEEKAVRGSRHTVYISRALSDAVNSYYPGDRAPHSVVHLGVDPAEVAAVRADPQPLRRRAELPAGPLLVACGRLVPVKGFGPLLEALAILDQETAVAGVPPAHLALVGVGPEETPLRRLAGGLGIASRVTFLGDVPRHTALGWMSVADVAVVPSLWESFCYVCAEMMAFDRPVVATAVDSLRELIPGPEYGYPVAVSGPLGDRTLDPHDLADALRLALADPAEAARRGAAAGARIAAQFTNRRFAQGVSTLCHELTGAAAHA